MLPSRHRPSSSVSAVVAAALVVLAVDTTVQWLPSLPAPGWLLLPALAGAALGAWRPRLRLIGLALLAFAWCAWRAGVAVQARLPPQLGGHDIEVTGTVAGLPRSGPRARRFSFRVARAWRDGHALAFHGRVHLAWYGHARDPRLRACSRWHLRVRLRRPRGYLDPGAFDSERSALQRHLLAVGYVRAAGRNRPLGPAPAMCLDGWRAQLSARLAAALHGHAAIPLLQALAVGDKRGLDAHDWRVARATGVSHLLAISGFHIGVAALAGAGLVRLLWWLWPALALRWPRPRAAAVAGLLSALPYAALAGFALPTLRALLMIAVVAWARGGRRTLGVGDSLGLALLVLLACDPLALLAAGFWLSFAGVALLLYGLGGRSHGGYLRRLGRAQLLMTVTLLPLTAAFFGQVAPLGALANLVAIPLVSLLVVPLTLAGTALLAWPRLATLPLHAAALIMQGLWWCLGRMAQWPLAQVHLALPPWWAVPLALLGVVWLWLPSGLPARWLGLALCLPLLWPARGRPQPGGFRATVLDVGQGLAVTLRTRHHALVYDTGPRYPSGFSLGRAVVVPALHARGVRHLDMLMVSHGDNDHAGGAPAVLRAFPAPRRLSGEPGRVGLGMRRCHRGQHWRWDGVRFRVLYPGVLPAASDHNDHSCVLLVSGRGGRLLLTGDISARAEPAVATALPAGPPLVLLVPHHGSHSSSSVAFIRAAAPRLAVVSAGWHNRYHHPSPQVVARYRRAGVPLFNTATSGAVVLTFPAAAAPRVLARWRLRQPRYWREGRGPGGSSAVLW